MILDKIVKSYGAVDVVHGIDLEMQETEFAVLVVPPSCGKSTTLRMIAGLITGSRRETATWHWCFRAMHSTRISTSPTTSPSACASAEKARSISPPR